MLTVVLTMLAGLAAGALGAMLGIGGGVLLVPLLDTLLGFSFGQAAGISLIGVLATATSVAVSSETRALLNVRLAIVLLIFSVSGASIGAEVMHLLSERTYQRIFGVTAAVIAGLILLRIDKRNLLPTESSTGVLGGLFRDADTGVVAAYRIRRVAVAASAAMVAGMLATFIGIGGGILIVPVLNSACGVPMRVAAATSAFMIGITAVPGAVARWNAGHLGDFELAAATAVAVIAGYRLGVRLSTRAPVRALKLLMSVILAVVALRYLGPWN